MHKGATGWGEVGWGGDALIDFAAVPNQTCFDLISSTGFHIATSVGAVTEKGPQSAQSVPRSQSTVKGPEACMHRAIFFLSLKSFLWRINISSNCWGMSIK